MFYILFVKDVSHLSINFALNYGALS